MWERIGRVKVWKFMGWGEDSLLDKAKAACTNKAKQIIHSLLPISGQVFRPLQESSAASCVTVACEEKRHRSECLPLPASSPSVTCWCHTAWGDPLVSWGQLPQLCPLPASVHPPTHSWVGGGWEAEKALAPCKHCSAITKTPLCYQHCFQHKSRM